MPLFHYRALDRQAKKIEGVIEAESERVAKLHLRERGLMVSSLTKDVHVTKKQQLKEDTLLLITDQLAQLISAGVPLYESLLALEEQYRNEPYHRVILSLSDKIKGGSSLSDAMSAFPESFSSLYLSMVAAGEASGALPLVLQRLSELLRRSIKLKSDLFAALIYPAILAIFCCLVIALLLGFVVPSIEGIFAGRELNFFTNFIISLSHTWQKGWWLILGAIAAGAALFRFWIKTEKGKAKMEAFFMRLPLIRRILIESALARLTRTLATLLQGGVPLIEALSLAAGSANNRAIEEIIHDAKDRIAEGSSLSKELKDKKVIPPLVARMAAVGEETGHLPEMLIKIAETYEETLEKTLAKVMALAQPVILIIMGAIIGLVMMGILLPLSDLSSLTGGSI